MAIASPKPEETVARDYADRLLLEKLFELNEVIKISELAEKLSDQGIGLSTVRSLLTSNPDRFAYYERRWIPASRLSGRERPIASIIEGVLAAFDGPMPISTLVTEVCRTAEKPLDDLEPVILRLLEKLPGIVVDAFDRASLLRWGFVAFDEPYARGLALNKVTKEEVETIEKALGTFDAHKDGAVAEAVQKLVPVNLKALGAYFWKALAPAEAHLPVVYNASEYLREALSVEGLTLLPDGTLASPTETKRLISTAVKHADKLVATIEVEDAQPIEVKPEDVEQIVKKVLASDKSVTGTALLEEMYEITPGSRTFKDDLKNLLDSVKGEQGIVWVGGDRLQRIGLIPEGIDQLPEPFQYEEYANVDEEDEPVDVELTDEGLNTTLRKLINHPLATDVEDEVHIPAPKVMPDTQRLVLKSIHRELGTFPLCQFYDGWFDGSPNLQELVVVDPSGKELTIWMNLKDRISYNWIDWWLDQPIENGAVFNLTKTKRPNVLEFSWHEQPDSVVYINKQRMEVLREIAANSDGKTCFKIMTEVIQPWTKGVDFLTLLAEMNIVRRVRSRLVASLLSSYECFYQRQNSSVWHYDPKKVELGFSKAKKKFIKK